MESRSNSLNGLIEAIERLSPEEKLALTRYLLSSSNSSVVMGNHQVRADLVIQINSADKETIGDLLDAVARRIASDN